MNLIHAAMISVKEFSTSEEAQVCAAYLKNNGIDATVFDERGFGGNLLGATSPGSIRIEVPDQQEQEALERLATYEAL